jgi:tRNA 2-thiocytidine biosynthesis protein TtcA
MARALGDVRPSQLSDHKLFDFLHLSQAESTVVAARCDTPDRHAWLAGDSEASRPFDIPVVLHA